MCESCGDAGRAASAGRRLRLWEIDNRLHCSVIGTCLTLGDLGRIERRLKIEPLKDATDFQIHGNFVVWAGHPGPAARQMQKLLERRYAVTIRRFAAGTISEDVARLWEASLQDGDIPGPYWALLTHPQASEALTMRAFGQVHMLSHLLGAANRADIRRLVAMEDERDALAERLASAKRRIAEQDRDTRRLVDLHAAEMRGLTNRLAVTASLEHRVRQLEEEVHAFGTGETHAALQAELQHARTSIAALDGELAEKRGLISSLVGDNLRLRQAGEQSDEKCRALTVECEAIERLLHGHLAVSDDDAPRGPTATDAVLDLGGRRIVYVGGRGGVIPHLRAVVERFGGTFLHHDGGIEEQTVRLDGLLGQCDAVFCPIDCISHDACLRAKRACRQQATTFVPLRTCSLSSFVAGLRQLAGAASTHPATYLSPQSPNALPIRTREKDG